jgi:hypothetical protein
MNNRTDNMVEARNSDLETTLTPLNLELWNDVWKYNEWSTFSYNIKQEHRGA